MIKYFIYEVKIQFNHIDVGYTKCLLCSTYIFCEQNKIFCYLNCSSLNSIFLNYIYINIFCGSPVKNL